MRDMSLTLAPDDLGVLGNLTGTERKRKDIRECVENECSVRLKRIRVEEEEEGNGERSENYYPISISALYMVIILVSRNLLL